MLHEFIDAQRDAIIFRTRQRVGSRAWPSASTDDLEHGVPLFLTQLGEALRRDTADTVVPSGAIGSTAARHGAELLGLGFNVSQVVHVYGDICQAITELAAEQRAPMSVNEFRVLNHSLDNAIAAAVTEHARITAEKRAADELERLGHAAHELRDILNTAFLAYQMLKQGTVAINGFTGAVLGRSLMGLRSVIDGTLSEVRLTAGIERHERLLVVALLDEVASAGLVHAQDRQIQLTIHPVDPGLAVIGDAQLLTSALMNLVHNALKNTPVGGRVGVRPLTTAGRLIVEVEDQSGGIPATGGDVFQPFGERRSRDRTGLGMGLSIARKAMRAHGGDILVRDMPGKGCVFMIEMGLAGSEESAAQTSTPAR